MAGTPLRLISSMATRALLAELAPACEGEVGALRLEAAGGVDVARRIRDGEEADVVVLASDAIDELTAAGRLVAGSRVDLVRSDIAVAVREGAPRPDIGTEDALRRAVAAAPSLAYSTGPSGRHLQRLFERWGIAAEVAARTVQAPPGVPVGRLVAEGGAALGFQQWPELIALPGITVLGPLPAAVQQTTVFAGAVAAASARPAAARALLARLAAPETAAAKRRHGMEPA